MRVDEAVVTLGLVRAGPHHPGGEGAELAGQVVLAEPLVGARGDVADDDARLHLDGGRQVGRRGAGEDLDLDAALGQLVGDLDDVDVHAARVTGARLLQRGGVDAEHRDAVDAFAAAHASSLPRRHRAHDGVLRQARWGGPGSRRAWDDTVSEQESDQMWTSVRPCVRMSTPRATRCGPTPTSVPRSVEKAARPSTAPGSTQAAESRRLRRGGPVGCRR